MAVLSDRRSTWPWATLATITAIACGCFLATPAANLPPTLLAPLAFSLVGTLVVAHRYHETGDALDPLILFSVVLIFYFGVHTVWLHQRPAGYAPFATPYREGLANSTLLLGSAYIGLVAAFRFTRLRPRPRVERSPYSNLALWIVFAFGFAANLYGIRLGAFQKAGTLASANNLLVIQTLGTIALVVFAVSAVQHYRLRSTSSRAVVLTQGLLLLGFGLAIGHKSSIVSVIFVWLAARHYVHRRIRIASIAVTVLVFVCVLTPIVQSGRDPTLLADRTATEQVSTTLDTLPARAGSLVTHPDTMLEGFDIINRRTNGSESFALAYQLTPHVNGFQYGASFSDVPLSLVPDQLFPRKQPSDPTRSFSLNYAGVSDNGFNGLAISPTIPGDLYVNFGLAGVLIGFVLLGGGLKCFTVYVKHANPLIGVPLYGVLILKITVVELAVARFGASVLYALAVFVLVTLALRRLSELTESTASLRLWSRNGPTSRPSGSSC